MMHSGEAAKVRASDGSCTDGGPVAATDVATPTTDRVEDRRADQDAPTTVVTRTSWCDAHTHAGKAPIGMNREFSGGERGRASTP